MTDTNRTMEQDRKNGSYSRSHGRTEPERQRGYDQDDYYTSRDDREESFEDRVRGRFRTQRRPDRFASGSAFEDRDEFTRRGVGYGNPSDQFGAGRSSYYEEATDPEYWRDRADRFRRTGAQDQGDWNERLWRSARGEQGSGYDDPRQNRFDRYAPHDVNYGRGDWQRSSEYGQRDEASRFVRGQHAPDWRESQFGKGPKGYKRSDERIAEEINQCLMDDHRIDASDIEVKVQNGEVSLTGTVSDRRCRRDVEDLVESISGVSEVSNQLKVQRANETTNERGSSRSATNPATKSNSASRPGGSDGA